MNKLKKKELPQKRALTVDEIISKYPMTVRILMVQLVEQIERLQKKKPQVTEEWIEERAKKVWMHFLEQILPVEKCEDFSGTMRFDFQGVKNLIRSLVEEVRK